MTLFCLILEFVSFCGAVGSLVSRQARVGRESSAGGACSADSRRSAGGPDDQNQVPSGGDGCCHIVVAGVSDWVPRRASGPY